MSLSSSAGCALIDIRCMCCSRVSGVQALTRFAASQASIQATFSNKIYVSQGTPRYPKLHHALEVRRPRAPPRRALPRARSTRARRRRAQHVLHKLFQEEGYDHLVNRSGVRSPFLSFPSVPLRWLYPCPFSRSMLRRAPADVDRRPQARFSCTREHTRSLARRDCTRSRARRRGPSQLVLRLEAPSRSLLLAREESAVPAITLNPRCRRYEGAFGCRSEDVAQLNHPPLTDPRRSSWPPSRLERRIPLLRPPRLGRVQVALLRGDYLGQPVQDGDMQEGLALPAHPHPHTFAPRHPYQLDSFMRQHWQVRASSAAGGALALTLAPVLFSPACAVRMARRTARSSHSTAVSLYSRCTARTLLGDRNGGAHPRAPSYLGALELHSLEKVMHHAKVQPSTAGSTSA
jgi:hypothetical protein